MVEIYVAPTVSALLAYLSALPRDRKNIVFCEDRLTLEAERAVADAQGVSFGTSVTTFARFLRDEARGKALSKQGSVLVVGNAARKLAPLLGYFGKNPAGCAARLYETIAQLRAALVTPDMLDEAAAQADGALAGKLKDIALVYRGYLDFLAEGYYDESDALALLPRRMRGGALEGAHVIFAGFSSFTRQAAEGIRAAIDSAASVSGVFIGGDAEAYTNGAVADFEKYCKAAGETCRFIALPSDLCGSAEFLRQHVFDPMRVRSPFQTDSVRIFEGESREDELSFIASAIKSEVLDRGMRFRDVAVFLSDVSDYAVALEKTFSEYRIPYFSDAKKSIAAHPLISFVLRWIALLSEGFDPSDADAFAASVFFVKADAAEEESREARKLRRRKEREEFRNYLAKYASFRGGALRPVKSEAFGAPKDSEPACGKESEAYARAVSMQALFASAFEGARSSAFGGEYCRLIRRLLKIFNCEKIQEETAFELGAEGYFSESKYVLQGVACLDRVLTEAEGLLGGVKLRADEFGAILSEGLASLEVSLIPQYLDAVYVGDISESKKSTAKIVFCGRLTDSVPVCGADTALISDRDIDRLRALRVEIQPKIREVNARARENAALALCGFTDRLYLTYPASLNGKECKRSEIVDGVRCSFVSKNGTPLPVFTRSALENAVRTDAAAYMRYLGCTASEKAPAVREILIGADAYRRGLKSSFSVCAGVYEALKERGDAPSQLLEYAPSEPFVPIAGELAIGGRTTVSPSFIEGYFACPYRNFAERALVLSERDEKLVRVTDTGNFVHDVLRRFADAAKDLQTEEECERFLTEQANALLAAPPYCFLADTQTGEYSAKALVREAVLVGLRVYENLKNSDFRIAAAEVTFGYADSPYAGIPLLRGGCELRLSGKIDRVDKGQGYVRVIDYKTGSIDVKEDAYYSGRKMQLELYLSAVKGEDSAAGAYYFPAKVAYHKEGEEPFCMQGFTVRSDEVVRLSDKTVEEGAVSRYIGEGYKKKNAKGLSESEFEDFISYSVLAARGAAEETARGCIVPSPYDGACGYCPYGGLCGYDATAGGRVVKGIKAEEIARIARAEKEKL